MFGHSKDIFIAAPAHIHTDDMVFGQLGRNFHHMGQGVAWLEGGNDPLKRAAQLKGLKRLCIGNSHIFCAADFMQPRMLGADPGII